jgi:hypothetical protein
MKEVAIYALIHSDDLEKIEKSLKNEFDRSKFKKIEQNSVLIFNDLGFDFSVEYDNNLLYLSGRNKDNLENTELIIEKIVRRFKEDGILFSIDYQEENPNGTVISKEFNISNGG